MQISNTLKPYMAAHAVQPSAQKTSNRPPCTTHSPFSDFFTREEAWSSGPEGYSITSSPYLRLSDSYDRWKAQMSGAEDPLPDSKGWTEENLAYLREHYSGELGWEERMDVLNKIRDMGMLTGNQTDHAYGGGIAIIRFEDMKAVQTAIQSPLQQSNPWETSWDVLFEDKPVAGFHTLDDVLTWAEAEWKKGPDEAEIAFTKFLVDLRG